MKLAITQQGTIDFKTLNNGRLAIEDTLDSAVLISLFTDRRAHPDDVLPDRKTRTHPVTLDKRGWCGDALMEDGDRIGSRLWLLTREKQTEETRRRAVEYCEEALQWMINDRLIASFDIDAQWHAGGRLNALIVLSLNDGETRTYDFSDIARNTYAV